MTEVFEALCPECLAYGMSFGDFDRCDHSEIGMFLEGHRDLEERRRKIGLSNSFRAAMALGERVLLGLDGKPYKNVKTDFPELFEEDSKRKKAQTWQEQERIFRRFLKLP